MSYKYSVRWRAPGKAQPSVGIARTYPPIWTASWCPLEPFDGTADQAVLAAIRSPEIASRLGGCC